MNDRFDNADGHMGKSEISGIEIPHDKGQYTLKHYLIGSMMPSFVKKILPKVKILTRLILKKMMKIR